MKITVVMNDYKKEKSNLIAEHGLSLIIEKDSKYILYDTGKSLNTYLNIKKLGLEKIKFDYIILSHGHYDHAGGLEFLENMLKEEGKIIVGNNFFHKKDKYHLYEKKEKRFIGNKLVNDKRFIEIKEEKDFGFFKIIPPSFINKDLEEINEGLSFKKGEKFFKDNFEEEISLFLDGEKKVLITGCTHNSLFNFTNNIKENLDYIIGGLHYKNKSDKEINEFIKKIENFKNTKFYLFHCTGNKLINKLKEEGFYSKSLLLGERIEI